MFSEVNSANFLPQICFSFINKQFFYWTEKKFLFFTRDSEVVAMIGVKQITGSNNFCFKKNLLQIKTSNITLFKTF